MHTRCSGTNRGGGPCNAEVRPGRAWCRWHDPELEDERAAWRSKGGKARSNQARAKKGLSKEPLSTDELLGYLSVAFKATLTGNLAPNIANALGGLARSMAEIRKASEVEERLAALEAALPPTDRRFG
jgi:hypothetical protein